MCTKVTLQLINTLSVLGLGFVSGCAPTVFMGATTSVATSVAEERGIGGVISDTEIKARIFSLYAESNLPLNSSIDIVVRQGKVLLTGIVDTPKIQIEAVRLAWIAKGVKEVHDEIQVGQDKGLGETAKDSWISTRLKTKLLFDDHVSSINYNLHTLAGTVYLMGIAKNQAELDHVIEIIRNTSGVKQVISYVHISRLASNSQDALSPSSPSYQEGSYEAFAEPATEATPHEDVIHEEPVTPSSLHQPNGESAFD